MRVLVSKARRGRAKKVIFACVVMMGMLGATMASVSVINDTAEARGPAYDGPTTVANGPAYFGPAPNPYPYCDSPTYFDPFPENVDPIGRMDVGDTASVTTDGVTMALAITAEGNPDTQYPGFFPNGADGSSNDQAKGIELAEGDTAEVTLSAPLFYSQWIFTDVDQPDEGFTVTPRWTAPGQAAVFGGDNNFTFDGTTNLAVQLDDTNGASENSQALGGRVQVDFLGAVTGIEMERTFPSNGQSGFAVGGGCEAAGAAKVVVDGPTWNGSSFDVTYELRMRNNLPSTATIQAVIDDAVNVDGASTVTGTPQGITLSKLQLTDDLRDPAFSDIEVTARSATGNLVLNQGFDGVTDFELIDSGSVAAESNEVITLSVSYTPDLSTGNWADCQAGYTYLNQTEVSGNAASVAVSDLSDDGTSAAPSDNNGSGGVDDPTPVTFPCPPGSLQIVKTVVEGPNGDCPTFANGTPGDGETLQTTVDDIVTYCVAVLNPGPGAITNVAVSDPQAPGSGTFAMNDLGAGDTDAVSYDVQVDLSTPTTNTATATGDHSDGRLDPVQDTAVIAVSPKDQPLLEIIKTVVEGPNGDCPAIGAGTVGLGDPLEVVDQDVVTYCISVQNTGPGDATDVLVTDAQAPQDYAVDTLVTGAGASISYDITVDASTPTTNTANADYSGPDGPRDRVSDPAQISVSRQEDPTLEIVKTVVPGPNGDCPANFDGGTAGDGDAEIVSYGDTVTYCVSVRNVGGNPATSVVVADPQAPSALQLGTIAVGAEASASYDVEVDASTPLRNTATATGVGPNGDVGPVSDTAVIAPADADLAIVKTAVAGPNGVCPAFDDGIVGEGDALPVLYTETVTYCISVKNTGANPATGVTITDPQSPGDFALGNLPAGAERTRSYDVIVDENTETRNVATVSGQGPNGDIGPVSDPANINPAPQPEPILEIVKTAVAGPNGTCPAFEDGVAGPGDALSVDLAGTVTYCVSIRNTGSGDATNVRITDEQAPASPYEIGDLAASAGAAVQYDVVVGLDTPLRNTAVVTGSGPTGPVDQADDDAVIDLVDTRVANISLIHSVSEADQECLTVAKELNSLVANAVDTAIIWCAEVVNTGNVPLTNVVLNAPAIGVEDFDVLALGDDNVLMPGESQFIPVTGAIGAGGLLSPGTVTGVPADAAGNPSGLAEVNDLDDAEVREAAIRLDKTVVPGPAGDCALATEQVTVPAGSDVTWCFTVTNTGTVDLLVAEVVDLTLAIRVPIPEAEQLLAPGDAVTVTAESEAPANGFVNDAEVVGQPLDDDGEPLDGAPPVDDDDPAEIDIPMADLAITKSVSDTGPIAVGSQVTYTLVVTNNGPDAADGVKVVDQIPAGIDYVTVPTGNGWTCSLDGDERGFSCLKSASMANGATETLTYVGVTTGLAANGVALTNVATVSSDTPDGDDSNNEDSSTTRTSPPVDRPPPVELPEYPGPFDPPAPPLTLPEPDEVLGLAITGAASNLLAFASALMLALGGMLTVGARRARDEDGF